MTRVGSQRHSKKKSIYYCTFCVPSPSNYVFLNRFTCKIISIPFTFKFTLCPPVREIVQKPNWIGTQPSIIESQPIQKPAMGVSCCNACFSKQTHEQSGCQQKLVLGDFKYARRDIHKLRSILFTILLEPTQDSQTYTIENVQNFTGTHSGQLDLYHRECTKFFNRVEFLRIRQRFKEDIQVCLIVCLFSRTFT